jgi:hypothetical protein
MQFCLSFYLMLSLILKKHYLMLLINRQIKVTLSKQGGSIGEHKFHALEMNTFYYALEWKSDF